MVLTARRCHAAIEVCASLGMKQRRINVYQQQKVLVEHINSLSEAGIPPTPSMVRVFAFETTRWPRNLLSGKGKAQLFLHSIPLPATKALHTYYAAAVVKQLQVPGNVYEQQTKIQL